MSYFPSPFGLGLQCQRCLSTYLFAASGSEQAEYCELRMRGLPDVVVHMGEGRIEEVTETEKSS